MATRNAADEEALNCAMKTAFTEWTSLRFTMMKSKEVFGLLPTGVCVPFFFAGALITIIVDSNIKYQHLLMFIFLLSAQIQDICMASSLHPI